MRTILDTKNDRGMFATEGFGEYNIDDRDYDTYDSDCVESSSTKKKMRHHRHNRYIELIEFYDYDAESFYDDGVDAYQKHRY